ncbi:MAG: cyclic pyranopterin monophosphate synthase MoaC [Alphaproteobacteria bacterium]|nr:cyclic pyranopterin monophosphate synthase MoaC [Rhodobiaceae bacterium]|tara:strand:- start:1143 stop:1619 length:477 start_codon:yes stop_codon:yes gene_type:complete
MKKPSHLNQKGEAHMVDISQKEETKRKAKAEGFVKVKKSTIETIKKGNLDKGDLFGSARIAGIMAAKKTSDLIPLCHILSISSINIDITIIRNNIHISCEVINKGQTGVEMEALTAVSVSCLTIYDMIKGIDREAIISEIKLINKSGGKSGEWSRNEN